MGVQLDNAAKNTDAATRERCHPEHQKLTDRACAIEHRASDCQQTLQRYVDNWHQFDEQYTDICAVLNELPPTVDITSDAAGLQQQVTDLEDAVDKLQSQVTDVNELGHHLLDYINSPHIHSQVDILSDRLHGLTKNINTDIQR